MAGTTGRVNLTYGFGHCGKNRGVVDSQGGVGGRKLGRRWAGKGSTCGSAPDGHPDHHLAIIVSSCQVSIRALVILWTALEY